ncbi:MAG: hypothetical protein LQ348_006552 [Seirophora lacunosa]|nr:MAG: hypothetical protein LQ348_006552 [Seirophora lacunosa]
MAGTSSDGESSDLSLEDISTSSFEDCLPVSPAWPTISDVQRALRPLQATADRVGKQVEEFAETLDRLSKTQSGKLERECTHALALVEGYRKITRRAVEYLRGVHGSEKQGRPGKHGRDKLRKSASASDLRRSHGEQHTDHTTLEDLQRWEQEEQTWHLLGLILRIEYPSSDAHTKGASSSERLLRPTKERGIHQYSSEREVWSNFLAHDDQAWERYTVINWLKACADDCGHELEQVIPDIEENADLGSGLWAHSWLYTKESIKGQKRLRSWPQVLAPDSPGIDSSLRNSGHAKSLVTQLDPDAITRQNRDLQPQDSNFERATWMACWNMLRCGQDWQFIRAWCQERVGNWRAITMRGDPRQHTSMNGKFLPYLNHSADWQSRALWRKSCALAARSGVLDKYEAAVYGALSGYLPSVERVCGSWNDYLFAHYNSYLLRSFDQYVATYLADQLPYCLHARGGLFEFSVTGGRRTQSGNQLIEKMRRLKKLAHESRDPMKQLQGSLVGKTFGSFVRKYGAQLLHQQKHQAKLSQYPSDITGARPQDSKKPLIRTDDYQVIRMITHIILIFLDLEPSWLDNAQNKAAGIFVEAYVDFLGKAGKQQLLPLYASRLSPTGAIRSLSRQLPRILEFGERQTVMQLMKQHGIDVPSVLNEQLWMIMKEIESKTDDGSSNPRYPTLRIIEVRGDKSRGEIRNIRESFMGNVVTDDQHDLINGFEWYLLLDDYWEKTLATGAVLYKHFLNLGDSIDGENGKLGNQSKANSRTRASQRGGDMSRTLYRPENEQYLFQQSNSFLNLEQLVQVLNAFEGWQATIANKPSVEFGGSTGKQWREDLRKACEDVESCIRPLQHGWLQNPRDDEEIFELEEIRKACLPEVLLAYIVVLNSSAQYVSRECLLKSLEVGATVASRGSDLAPCFVSAGRMPELVDALAFTSTTMLLANEHGGGKKRTPARLGLWSTQCSLNTGK